MENCIFTGNSSVLIMLRNRIGLSSVVITLLSLFVSCSKTVDVTAVSLNESSVTLTVGETTTLVATVEPSFADFDGISWTSSDPLVASVENGIVRVHRAGTASIIASAGGVTSGICTVTVEEETIPEVIATTPEEVAASTDETVSTPEETTVSQEEDETSDEGAETALEESETDSGDTEEVASGEEQPVSDDTEVANETGIETDAEPTAEKPDNQTVLGESFIYDVDFGEEGSYIAIDNFIKIYDWRGREFEDYPNYWEYYGPFVVTVDIDNAECDMNGERQKLPHSVTLIQTKPGETSVKDPTSGSVVSLPENKFGYLMCKFSTVTLTSGFHIFVKAKVKYGFGTLQSDWITITVVNTVEP